MPTRKSITILTFPISALVFISAPAIPSGWALYGEALASLRVFVPIGVAVGRDG